LTESDQMLVLLQEKVALKKLDEEYATGENTPQAEQEHQVRTKRHTEISQEMVDLAKSKKTSSR